MTLTGDSLTVLKTMPENSIDFICTDPPYGLKFMGKDWDHGIPGVAYWTEALRVAKPGAHLFAFGGTRTFHRLVCAIEDAGWEIRDTVMWVYGSGFPKSHDVSKAIDKAAGAEREVLSSQEREGRSAGILGKKVQIIHNITSPATPSAQQWDGYGTALKPAWEPITIARKPLDGTVAQNVLKWGTGALNIDGCRVGTEDILSFGSRELGDGIKYGKCKPSTEGIQNPFGRWPANLIHDGSQEVLELFPMTGKSNPSRSPRKITDGVFNNRGTGEWPEWSGPADSGSAARFFYCAKASRSERDAGLEGMPNLDPHTTYADDEWSRNNMGNTPTIERAPVKYNHPTVKPLALMRYLIKLGAPPGAIILDLFCGSGSTLVAAKQLGYKYIGIDLNPDYVKIAEIRTAQTIGLNL